MKKKPKTDPDQSDTERLNWIRAKLDLPADTPMFSGTGATIAGTLHVVCSHAYGYEKYITAYECDDKQGEIARLTVRVADLEAAIRVHRDERGDDRCFADDSRLYAVLPEGDTRPERETAVTLENCAKYIECRQTGREYISPQRRIEELETELCSAKCDVRNFRSNSMRMRAVLDRIVPLLERLYQNHHSSKSSDDEILELWLAARVVCGRSVDWRNVLVWLFDVEKEADRGEGVDLVTQMARDIAGREAQHVLLLKGMESMAEQLNILKQKCRALEGDATKARAAVDGVDLRDIDQRDNATPDELRTKLLGAGLEIAKLRSELGKLRRDS